MEMVFKGKNEEESKLWLPSPIKVFLIRSYIPEPLIIESPCVAQDKMRKVSKT